MPLLPAVFFLAQATQGAPTDVPIHYRRPSAIVALAKGMGATLVADDAKSLVQVSGTPDQVRDAREYLRLSDVPRRSFLVRVTVSSPVDHFDWTVDARLTNGQRWKTADEETGSEVALDPTLTNGGDLKVAVIARCAKVEFATTLRLNKGQAQSLVLGKQIVQKVDVSPEGKASVSEKGIALPTVTIRYVGE